MKNKVSFARVKESFSGLYPKVEELRRISQSELSSNPERKLSGVRRTRRTVMVAWTIATKPKPLGWD
jgi:hypothetical protein